jgi:phosphatidylglycerophosphate synthase
MELIRGLFEAITNSVPSTTAKILLTFLLFFVNPYRNVKRAYELLKKNNLSGGVLIVVFYFAFAFVLGIPSVSRPLLSFTQGWESSIERLNTFDLKGKQFVYLFGFIFILLILTTIVIDILRSLYKEEVNGEKKLEFSEFITIFIAFTIGWFLIFSLLQNSLFGILPTVGYYVESRFAVPDGVVARIRSLYSYYNPNPNNKYGSEDVWRNIVVIFITPATVGIVYVTWRFGNGLLEYWLIEPRSVRPISIGSKVSWQVKAGSLPLIAVSVLLFASVAVSSGLDKILFRRFQPRDIAKVA